MGGGKESCLECEGVKCRGRGGRGGRGGMERGDEGRGEEGRPPMKSHNLDYNHQLAFVLMCFIL